MKMIEFIESPLGIVCVGVLSSLLGKYLSELGEKIYSKANRKLKHKKFINYLVFTGEAFSSGYTTSYAQSNSPFHQILYVNKYVIKIILEALRIIVTALSAIALLLIFRKYFISVPIIISIVSIMVTMRFKKIKKLYETYEIMFDFVYGDEYKKHMKEGMVKYWDKITGKESDKID